MILITNRIYMKNFHCEQPMIEIGQGFQKRNTKISPDNIPGDLSK